VVTAAEGNPLLAVETARAFARGERALGAGVSGAVRGAFASLTAAGRSFVELAAVAARGLEHAEILLLEMQAPAEAAAAALESGMLVATERLIGFRHALLREAVYADLSEPRRASLHESWARALLARTREGGARRAAEVARHLRIAGRDREAIEQLSLAAADARSVGALAEAAGYLSEASSMAPECADLLLELGEVQAWRGRKDEAEEAFAAARALLADTPLELARAWLRAARSYHGTICVPAMVRESCREALALLDGIDTPARLERREALAALVWAEAVAGSVQDAEQLLMEVHELTAGEPADDLSIYDIGHARALALTRCGSFVEAYAPAIAAGEAITRAGRPDLAYGCWANVAGAAAAAGEYERALEFLDRCAAVLAGKGLAALEFQLLGMRSFVELRVGRSEQARVTADAEMALADRLDSSELSAVAAHDRGLVALAEGDFVLAAELLQRALTTQAPISRPLTRLRRAEALVRASRVQEAEAELRETVLEPVRASDFPAALVPRLARVQGLVAALAGDRARALQHLGEAAEGWRRQVSTLTRGDSMAVVLADLGRPVVGLVEPEHELERVLAELHAIETDREGAAHAVFS
jgi:tetratricopeptide (TPR) repeat protein